MNRAQRYRLAERLAQCLCDEEYNVQKADLLLRSFGIMPHYDWDDVGNFNNYVHAHLIEGADDALLEMAEMLNVSTEHIGAGVTGHPKIWPDRSKFRLFISHISKDKAKATRLRDCLAPYNISGFVAHQDIEPTKLWENEIERALSVMDAFLAIHTPGFSESCWTQQEIGFAVARGVRVISFRMGEDPTGFISKLQAVPHESRLAEQIAEEVRELLASDALTKSRFEQVSRNVSR